MSRELGLAAESVTARRTVVIGFLGSVSDEGSIQQPLIRLPLIASGENDRQSVPIARQTST